MKVITYTDEQDIIQAFTVEGHAGFAQSGRNIVCSAISMLTISTVNGLEQYLSHPPVSKVMDGFLQCTLPELESDHDKLSARVILGTMLLGLKQVAETYGPRYISFEQRRWTPCCN